MTNAKPDLSTLAPTGTTAVEDRYDVVVAGAGFAGLALARALALGLGPSAKVALVTGETEGRPGPNADGRAVALSAASVRMLDQLGAWADCRAEAQPVTAIDITDSALQAGVRPILLSYDNLLGGVEPASHIVPNATLQSALWARVRETPGITVFGGTGISGFAAGREHIAASLGEASLGQASLGPGRRICARLLAATDGRRSSLRKLAGIQTVGWSYPQTGITVTVRHDRPHQGRAVQHFLPGGPFAMLPLPADRSCITWSETADEARRLLALDEPDFLAELERRAGGRLGAIELDGRRQSWPLEMFISRAFVAPRFALAGDAAHNVHPIAGQGLNLGFKDVAALAEAVADAHRLGLDIAGPATLARYERWRRFDTLRAAASFDALNRIFSTEGNLRRSLREFGLGVVDRWPGLKQRLVAQAAGVSGELPRLLRGEAI